MASGSDGDVCFSMRPKTKNQISEDIQDVTKKISVEEDGLMSEKSSGSHDEGKTKASKCLRGSEEGSSVSSDEELMSKKKLQRNSEEELQPKKRLSAETKRRREAVRSVREKKTAALESDSGSETEDSGEECFTRNKSISKLTTLSDSTLLKDQTSNPDDEKISTIKRGCVISPKNGKSEKDEDSSSAYNSGSEGNVKLSISENKDKKCPARKDNTSDSESDKDPIGLIKHKSSPLSKKSEESGSDGENKKNFKSAHESNHSSFENKTSSEDEKLSKLSLSNKDKRLKVQVNDSETDESELKLKGKQSKQKSQSKVNSGSSCESNADSDGKKSHTRKRGKSKMTPKETKSSISDSESDDTPLIKCVKTNSLKEEDSSDSDEPLNKSLDATVNLIKADLSGQQSSSDDDRPLVKTKRCVVEVKRMTKNEVAKNLKNLSLSGEENSSDESLVKKKTSNFPRKGIKQRVAKEEESLRKDAPLERKEVVNKSGSKPLKKERKQSTSDESETEETKKKVHPKKEVLSGSEEEEADKKKKELSDSEEEPTDKKKREANMSDSDESDKNNKNRIVKKEMSSSGSDSVNEGGKKTSSKSKSLKTTETKKPEISSSNDSSNSNSDDNTKKSKKHKKVVDKWKIRINNYKKYLSAAGIRINNYTLLWKGCKNDKQRGDKLQKTLEDHGLEGRPSMQKCQKIREKMERKREVEELDLNNIIDDDRGTGRYSSRSSRRSMEQKRRERTLQMKAQDKEAIEAAAKAAAEIKQRFSRIKDLIDSDSSSD